MVAKYTDKLGHPGPYLLAAGRALGEFYNIIKVEPRQMPASAQVQLMQAMVNHVVAYKAAGGHLVHKHHLAFHLVQSCCSGGNPSRFGTYEDEHENGIIAAVGESSHGSTWCISVFERLEVMGFYLHGGAAA